MENSEWAKITAGFEISIIKNAAVQRGTGILMVHPDDYPKLSSPEVKDEKCQACGKEASRPPHTCPYSEEMNSDSKTMCNCCQGCTHECAMDI